MPAGSRANPGPASRLPGACRPGPAPASLALAGFLCASSPLLADNCQTEQHQRFDFWIGEWRVENPEGQVVGRNSIESVLDGCALRETWQGGSGYNGQSLNTWDPASGQWRQFWTDNHHLTLHLSGGWQEDRMTLQGTRTDRQGREITDRISWIPLEDGIVRQHWQQSV
ncbi:MAG: hypothetical protein GVY11_04180, partial [Gammaproteobacteria bacterium]|nr:hypothetical protein [Gammaproteobacteria bacterium]